MLSRIAMDNVFRQSQRDVFELFAVAWDKMDQAKTILPRVPALAHTSFVKTGSRLIVSLIGCKIADRPCMHVYTVFDNVKHGGSMVGSMMVDQLFQYCQRHGRVPRRYFIKADNTVKETKNTICLYVAAWLLCALQVAGFTLCQEPQPQQPKVNDGGLEVAVKWRTSAAM